MNLSRASGILLHPTSLPGPHGSGDFGPDAYHFVDWLAAARQTYWQILPLGDIGPGNSPYMSSSAFAGNVLLIDLADLQQQGWLPAGELRADPPFGDDRVDFARMVPWRTQQLSNAARRFSARATPEQLADYQRFCTTHAAWLDDYALFMALAESHAWAEWNTWPDGLAQRLPAALAAAREKHAERIAFWKFCQWRFFDHWARLKAYANTRGIRIIGDAPIFIAYQSAEVWARQELFELDTHGRARVVAGVPPDYFSATGQRWGNPLYRWSAHADEGFAWWITRIRHTFGLVDLVRIDHFRGFADYWEVPASEPTAIHGRWLPAPGAALFEAVHAALGPLAIIAEDLGIITPAVDALRRQFNFPGMRILHFAFGGNADNAYLPHNYDRNTVAYTGTHDNNTTQGWWHEASAEERSHVAAYLGRAPESLDHDIHWALIRSAMASVADTAIVPLQDVLGLGAADRMNLPGKGEGYWEWRFNWAQFQPWHASTLAHIGQVFGRVPP
ncbi:4-alpha-glucanotransferase [Variovorax sp. HJSM1_2]|uniref:4-alpha-glucanotransferase n=1 Tax=Variovorax sp. HJSM1_2 TaxID=3366263 RepID=UPI003BDBD27B